MYDVHSVTHTCTDYDFVRKMDEYNYFIVSFVCLLSVKCKKHAICGIVKTSEWTTFNRH